MKKIIPFAFLFLIAFHDANAANISRLDDDLYVPQKRGVISDMALWGGLNASLVSPSAGLPSGSYSRETAPIHRKRLEEETAASPCQGLTMLSSDEEGSHTAREPLSGSDISTGFPPSPGEPSGRLASMGSMGSMGSVPSPVSVYRGSLQEPPIGSIESPWAPPVGGDPRRRMKSGYPILPNLMALTIATASSMGTPPTESIAQDASTVGSLISPFPDITSPRPMILGSTMPGIARPLADEPVPALDEASFVSAGVGSAPVSSEPQMIKHFAGDLAARMEAVGESLVAEILGGAPLTRETLNQFYQGLYSAQTHAYASCGFPIPPYLLPS